MECWLVPAGKPFPFQPARSQGRFPHKNAEFCSVAAAPQGQFSWLILGACQDVGASPGLARSPGAVPVQGTKDPMTELKSRDLPPTPAWIDLFAAFPEE